MTTQPLLELHLHLVNGNTHKFIQNDPQLVQQILQQINPKIFSEPSLVVFSQDSVMTYPGSALTGLSLIMEAVPDELLQLIPGPATGRQNIREITGEDYRERQHGMPPIVEGEAFVMLQEVELITGHRFYLEIEVGAAVSKMRERQLLHNAFSQLILVCRRLGGGVSIWNWSQVVSLSHSPKPEVPTTAWPAEALAG